MAESEFADHQTSRTALRTSADEWTLRSVRCWPAKLADAPSSSTADERTANGGGKAAMALASFSMALSSPEAMASTKSPDSATPGGTGRPWRVASPRPTALDPTSDLSTAFVCGESVARAVAESDGLGSKQRSLAGFREGDDLFHFYPSIVTSPASPSTRTKTPSAMRSVASRVPTTPGMPYSRATIAACERRPPASVTIPPRSGSRMLNASVVDSVTSTSPLTIWPNSEGPETRRAGPSYIPLLAASP